MAVHDDWQGCGIGTALLEATPELTVNWLDITRESSPDIYGLDCGH